uniref:acetyl-CoA carboxylase carboxyltransferase beta subunit n=1 Tax=Euphorbia schlechtendalii TaxID=216487 RepID=UPI002001D339|nr:acetyl-CoA carboxylase carboxyltransferase beta subunit [Euphorbia schlechtendalii]UNS16251.1 acetyl-CoA carboxylase carboxyltransferase beta subunit [Euphorbia schlechtendalii]
MEKRWFNSILSNVGLGYRCGLSKSMDSFSPFENTSLNEGSEGEDPFLYKNTDSFLYKHTPNWSNSDNSSSSNVDHLVGLRDIWNFSVDETFLAKHSNKDNYDIDLESENQVLESEIGIDDSFLGELESSFYSYLSSSYLNNGSRSGDSQYDHSMYDTQYSWNNYIKSYIEHYLSYQIFIDSSILSLIDNSILSGISESDICGESENSTENESAGLITSTNDTDLSGSSESDTGLITSTNDTDLSGSSESDTGLITSTNDTDLSGSSEGDTGLITSTNDTDLSGSSEGDVCGESENSPENDLDRTQQYKHLWVRCENEDCYGLNYKQFLKSRMNLCEYCGYHLKMSSSDRIELLIDPATWDPMDEDMVALDTDPIGWDEEPSKAEDEPSKAEDEPSKAEDEPSKAEDEPSKAEEEPYKAEEEPYKAEEEPYKDEDEEEEEEEEDGPYKAEEEPYKDEDEEEEGEEEDGPYKAEEEPYKDEDEEEEGEEEDGPYKDRIDSYQRETGLTEAVQTGTGQLNGIPVAVGVMDFQFIGGSMGSLVGEKITRLIEYATNNSLPLILVCASGGARMQEGSLSLMQMAKISCALYDYQSNKKLFYVSILTSPTTGGVTASFGMLGDIIIAEPDAYIAFAGKRVIEELLKTEVPEGSQSAEVLFEKGLVDSILPRNLLKGVLNELLQLHNFLPTSS